MGRFFALLSLISGFVLSPSAFPQGHARPVTICSLGEDGAKLLNSSVEFQTTIVLGSGYPLLREGDCVFGFAFGDDYQTFGDRFPARQNAQWRLMRKIFATPTCAPHARAVKGKFRGTVIRTPPTGTIPPDEMPLEVVIQSVSRVENAIKRCVGSPPNG
jgi:hypothetical protein